MDEVMDLVSSVMLLAGALGVLCMVGIVFLPYMWAQWKRYKHDMDEEGELYEQVVDALDKAEGRPVRVVIDEGSAENDI
jgi:hypothetical protein